MPPEYYNRLYNNNSGFTMATKDNHLGLREQRHAKVSKVSQSLESAFNILDNINSPIRKEKEKITSSLDDLKQEVDEIKSRIKNKHEIAERKRSGRRNQYLEKVEFHK